RSAVEIDADAFESGGVGGVAGGGITVVQGCEGCQLDAFGRYVEDEIANLEAVGTLQLDARAGLFVEGAAIREFLPAAEAGTQDPLGAADGRGGGRGSGTRLGGNQNEAEQPERRQHGSPAW